MSDYLIIARSARALAASAKRAGHKVYSMDCFNDEDTKKLSESVRCLQYQSEGFLEEELFSFTQDFISKYPELVIVTGSGFEAKPEQIGKLQESTSLIGNSAETIESLKKTEQFSALLNKYSIRHPKTLLSRPEGDEGYLIKQVGSEGGTHVDWLRKDSCHLDVDARYYYQEYIDGDVFSVVFLANGKAAKLVGCNRQLQTNKFKDMPFLYQGAVVSEELNEEQQAELVRIIACITRETGLRGLCGLDFIIDGQGEIQVLELNPRPPATFELHENGQSLFDAHISCFEKKRIEYNPAPVKTRKAYAILYASKEISLDAGFVWPGWVKDRPSTDALISHGSPVCTVHAEASSSREAKCLVDERLNEIELKVITMQSAA